MTDLFITLIYFAALLLVFASYYAVFRFGQTTGAMAERERRDAEEARIACVTARIEAQLREMEGEEWPGEIDVRER